MASGSAGGGRSGGGNGRRRGAQSRLTYRQMQANRNTQRQARRMRIARNNSSIPF